MNEALKLALKALEAAEIDGNCEYGVTEIIREALAQPVQEPVAWAVYYKGGGSKSLHWPEQHSPNGDANMFDAVPLCPCAPPPRPWVGLTKDDCKGMSLGDKVVAVWADRLLKEKNT